MLKRIKTNKGLQAIVVFLLVSAVAITFYPLSYTEASVMDEFNAGILYRTDGKTSEETFEKFIKIPDKYVQHDFILLSWNPLETQVALVVEYKNNHSEIYINNLTRNGIFTWRVDSFQPVIVKNYSFEELIDVVKSHDIISENPDPENISIRRLFTQENALESANKDRPTQEEIEEAQLKEIKRYFQYLEENWSEASINSIKQRWEIEVSNYEEFRNHPKIIEMYGSREELGF